MDYVLDASVAVKWFVEEDHSEAARYLLRRFGEGSVDLFAPSILMYEVGNALWRMVDRLKLLKAKYAMDTYSSFLQLPIHYSEMTGEDVSDSLGLSLKMGLTLYDMIYLKLSDKLAKTLITADGEILRKAGKDFKVAHLSETPK